MDESIFIHEHALVERGARIGGRTRVWAFAHVLGGAVIGEDCNICDHVFIENDVVIGDRVTIKSGVQVWDGIRLENDVFVGPNTTFTNDNYPRSKHYPDHFLKTVVRKGASIGANATVLAGIVVGANSMVGAGAVVTKDVPPHAIVKGNPARITGYVSTGSKGNLEAARPVQIAEAANIAGARVCRMPLVADLRGCLSFGQYDAHLPFAPQRYFIIFNVPSKEVRGEHAHRRLHQFLICVKGSCSVVIDDGNTRGELVLDSPDLGLYVPPMTWTTQYKYSQDAVLLVLASDAYDPEDYIRNYDEFIQAVTRR
ncbi:MAG TPA: WxcM-like domain-containing protein [Blastocatellia bacterium]|nr:WxcM-like domain-containing protein [Blastocatellia bacterium]